MKTRHAICGQPRPIAAGFAASMRNDLRLSKGVRRGAHADAPGWDSSIYARRGVQLSEMVVDAHAGGDERRGENEPNHAEQRSGADRDAEDDKRVEPQGRAVDD